MSEEQYYRLEPEEIHNEMFRLPLEEEKRLRKQALEWIPKRCLQLQLEIDKLKKNFEIHQYRYNWIIQKEQKYQMELINKQLEKKEEKK